MRHYLFCMYMGICLHIYIKYFEILHPALLGVKMNEFKSVLELLIYA